jgi:Class II flagellar assembly regulator
MRIEWTPALRPATQRRDDRAAAADRTFSLEQGNDASAATGTQGPRNTDALAELLTLQEISDELTGRRRAVARGEKLLHALDGLRLALLAGTLPRAQLVALAQLAQERAALGDDPRLAEILAEIELRAAVELAKLEQS